MLQHFIVIGHHRSQSHYVMAEVDRDLVMFIVPSGRLPTITNKLIWKILQSKHLMCRTFVKLYFPLSSAVSELASQSGPTTKATMTLNESRWMHAHGTAVCLYYAPRLSSRRRRIPVQQENEVTRKGWVIDAV